MSSNERVTSYLEDRYVDRHALDRLLQELFGHDYNVVVSVKRRSIFGIVC